MFSVHPQLQGMATALRRASPSVCRMAISVPQHLIFDDGRSPEQTEPTVSPLVPVTTDEWTAYGECLELSPALSSH